MKKEERYELMEDGNLGYACVYDESVVKSKVDRIEVYDGYILIKEYDGSSVKVCL